LELRHGTPEQAGMLPERVERARELCASWVDSGHTPSLSVCVARRGVIVLHEAFGVMGPEPDTPPIDRRTLFPLASVTKPIMAAVVMQCVEDGLLGLNRPVLDYVPEISTEHADEMLVHHLLTHTSGYVHYEDEPFLSHGARKLEEGFLPEAGPDQHFLQAALVQAFFDAPLVARPGEIMIYAGHNYELLAEIVRRVTRRPHWDVCKERVFAPLGMHDSFWIVPESEAARVVQRPLDAHGGAPESPLMQGLSSRQMQESPYGAGGVFSTPGDAVVFGQVFLNDGLSGNTRILSPASVAAMTHDQIPGLRASILGQEKDCACWGYGWGIESPTKWGRYRGSLRSLGSYDHGGNGGAYVWVDPTQELAAAFFETCLRQDAAGAPLWNCDLFQNVIAAAITD
jgi:CubicO group peptidase (beta-lactamase class C family)